MKTITNKLNLLLCFVLLLSLKTTVSGGELGISAENGVEILTVSLSSLINTDELKIYAQAGATVNYEGIYDAYKLFGIPENAYIYQQADQVLSISAIPLPTPIGTSLIIAFKLPSAGQYTLSFSANKLGDNDLWINDGSNLIPAQPITINATAAGVIQYTLFIGLPNTWNGTTWSKGTPPTENINAIIAHSNSPSSFTANNLTIESGANLTIEPSDKVDIKGTLTNDGNGIILKSNSSSYGQLFLPTNHTGVTGTVEHLFEQDKWQSFGFGVHNFAKGDVIPTNNTKWYIKEFVENRNITEDNTNYVLNWGYLSNNNSNSDGINGLNGYMGFAKDAAQTVSVTGEIHSSNKSYSLSYSPTSGEGWNLLANPYPTKLLVTTGWNIGNNVGNALYVRKAGQYYSAVNGIGDFTTIEVGQAFFIKTVSNTDIGFELDASTARTLDVPVAKKSTTNTLQVSVKNSNHQDHFFIYEVDGGAITFDKQNDALKMFGELDRPYIYQQADEKLSINGISMVNENVHLPFRVQLPSAGTYTVSFDNATFSELEVWIEDTNNELQPAHEINITATAAGSHDFTLHFKKKKALTNDIVKAEHRIYTNDKFLFVELNKVNNGQLDIYTVEGKLFRTLQLNAAISNMELPEGVYIIKLGTELNNQTKRIIIR